VSFVNESHANILSNNSIESSFFKKEKKQDIFYSVLNKQEEMVRHYGNSLRESLNNNEKGEILNTLNSDEVIDSSCACKCRLI